MRQRPKLLLLQPPVEDFYETEVRLQPIGLAYLKAAARRHVPEFDVEIRDLHRGCGRSTLPVPRELSYLKPYYAYPDASPFCTFHAYYHFGASWESVGRLIREAQPDVVGISSLFTPYYREALAVARLVKENSRADVILGGAHVSADPRSVLSDPHVDFVIPGEGERPLVEFLRQWLAEADWSQVGGLGYKKDGALHLNPASENWPLDELPLPDLSDLPLDRYRFQGRPLVFLVTSRSCPHRCSFCSVHETFGARYRRLSPERVLAEMKMRYEAGYRVFDFEDDNLTYYKDEMKEICRSIVEAFPERDVELVAMNGISYLSLDGELLTLMRQAGFTHLNLALVSSDLSVLETTKRPHTVEKYLEVVTEAHRLGFRITSYQILGLPFESLSSMVQTLTFAARQPVLLGASMFYLTPGSPLARELRASPTPESYFKARLTAMAIEGSDFTRDDLYTLFVTTRIINFLKAAGGGQRRRIGFEILERLFESGTLHAKTREGYRPLPKFKASLFFRIWEQLGFIRAEDGRRLPIEVSCSGRNEHARLESAFS